MYYISLWPNKRTPHLSNEHEISLCATENPHVIAEKVNELYNDNSIDHLAYSIVI